MTCSYISVSDNYMVVILEKLKITEKCLRMPGSDNSDVTCCRGGSIRPPNELHPECMPIIIPNNDIFYGPLEQRCMEFVRSMPSLRRKCMFGPREQLNQITAFLDARWESFRRLLDHSLYECHLKYNEIQCKLIYDK